MKKKIGIYEVSIYLVLIIFGILIAYPFYNVLIISLKSRVDYMSNPLSLFPEKVIWEAYKYLFSTDMIFNGFKVTGFIVVVGVAYNMLLTTTLAYGLSRPLFPGKKIFLVLILITMYFGGGLVPYYLVIMKLGLINKLGGLILPVGVNTFYLMIMITYFKNLPGSLFESARIDGAKEFTILRKIALPISKPIMVTIGLFYAVDRWNDWFLGMLVINDVDKFPLQLVLKTILLDVTASMSSATATALQSSGTVYAQSVKMAGVVITALPIILLYPFAQRYFQKGIMIGSIKD